MFFWLSRVVVIALFCYFLGPGGLFWGTVAVLIDEGMRVDL